jgi:molecular chaperone GrpE
VTGEHTDAIVEEGSDPWGLTPVTPEGAGSAAVEGSDPADLTPGLEPTGLTPEEEALTQLAAERDEYLADLQRLAAEFENYRKRVARDQERLVAHAHERLVRELLPVLDDLERALEAAERHEEAALIDGVKLVEQSLRKALVKEGLVEIDTAGAFDPHVHEALLAQPHDEAESGSVLEVVQRGYRLGDKVVRPARVIVAE